MRERILIVDDNRFAADALARILKIVGFDVTAEYSGQRAIEQMATLQPNLALIDIGMPDLDGFEVARRVRQQRSIATVILVALTAWAREEDQRRAYECGFDLHVAKPVSLQSLRNVLALLDSRRVPINHAS